MNSGRVAAVVATALATACQVVSYPPAQARQDGGPVATRGVVSHEARSQLRIYRDAAGCESVQTVNRQFRLATVVGAAGPARRVVEESYDVRHCLTSESASSEATITVWLPDGNATVPLFRITGRGAEGAPSGNLYRMTNRGCCGSQDLATYFSLLTGRMLFASSLPPRSLEVANTRTIRYLALHDTFSAAELPERAGDSTVVAVLQWGDDETPARRYLIRAERPEAFAGSTIRFHRDGRILPDTALVLFPERPTGRLMAEVELVAPTSNRVLRFQIPIEGTELRTDRATLPPGVTLTGGS